jgi:prolyl 4-hydroxylase
MKHALPHLERSSVISSNPLSDVRTSTNTFLHKTGDKDVNMILDKISDMTEKISGKSKRNHEPLQVVKYTPNQLYKEHYDCCVPLDSTLCKEDIKKFGMRHSTFLIYLNNITKGGETDFPLVNYRFKPKLGHGIFFFNLNSSETDYNKLSKHAGLPPIKEDKWVCNKWVRTIPYDY